MSTITGLKTARTRRLIAGVAAAAALLGASTACGGSAGAENADGTTTVRYQSALESHDRQQVLDVYVPWLKEQGFTDAVEAVEKNWAGSTGVSSKGGLIADKDISIWLDWLAGRGDVDPSKIKASDVYTNQFNPQS